MKLNKVIIDTNAFIYAVQKKRDLFEDLLKYLGLYEALVPKDVIKELEKKAEKKTDAGKAAKLALRQIDQASIESKVGTALENDFSPNIEIVGSKSKNTDDAILDLAKTEKAYILTNDRNLKSRAKKQKLNLIEPKIFSSKQ